VAGSGLRLLEGVKEAADADAAKNAEEESELEEGGDETVGLAARNAELQDQIEPKHLEFVHT